MLTDVAPHRFKPAGRGPFSSHRCQRCYLPKREHPVNHYTHARPMSRARFWPYALAAFLIALALILWSWT